MRPLDLILGALGLTALGLMLSSVPAVGAASPREAADPAALQERSALEGTAAGLESEQPASEQRVQCCGGTGLTPTERAARVRTLRRVLAPEGSDAAAMLERMRLDLLLQREAALTRREEREIS